MSNAGKKLQDIFDAGSGKLKELHESQRQAFEDSAQNFVEQSGQQQKTAMDAARQRAQELQAELQDGVDKSLERMRKKIETESEETKRHVQEALHKISRLTAQLEQSMSELNATGRSDLDYLKTEACHLLEREVQDKCVELQKHDFQIGKTFKAQAAFAVNTFQQKLDHGLVEIRGEDQVLHGKLFKLLLQNHNSVDTQVSGLLQKLSLLYKTGTESLNEKFQHCRQLLQGHVEVLVSKADQNAAQVEKQFHESHRIMTEESESSLQARLVQDADELRKLLQAAGQDVQAALERVQTEQETLGNNLESAVSAKCEEIRRQVDEQTAAALAAGKHRLQTSVHLQKSLEAATDAGKEKLRQELSNLQETVSQQIGSTAAQAAEELTVSCNEALESIYRAQQDAEKELQAMTRVSNKQINSAVADFLRRLEERRNLALSEIQNAVNGSTVESPDKAGAGAAPVRKSKKSKTKADADAPSTRSDT